MSDIIKLTTKLSKYGKVEVIKNDYVFTLYMINDTKFLDSGGIPFKILEIVTKEIPDKPVIEVLKNDSNYLLLVLKPHYNAN